MSEVAIVILVVLVVCPLVIGWVVWIDVRETRAERRRQSAKGHPTGESPPPSGPERRIG